MSSSTTPVASLAALLRCPACDAELRPVTSGARCAACDTAYPERDGILDLVRGGSGAPAAPAYDPHHYGNIERMEDRHFWFVARREAILDGLRRSVPDLDSRALFDIGCGSGGLVAYLARSGVRVAGACDAYAEALKLARSRSDVPLARVDEGRMAPLREGHTCLGLFDVLEHLDDDAGALRNVRAALAPGGVFALTVPAHPFLFGERDVRACHRRRYRRRELREKLQEAGFEVRLLVHFMGLLVPALALFTLLERVRRRLGRSDPDHDPWDTDLRIVPGLNGVLLAFLRAERRVSRLLPLPFGSSLLAVSVRRH